MKPKYPGIPTIMDGNSAAILVERESTDAAGAYPITPSSQMGEYWEAERANGHLNISGRPLIFIEPEGEHAAAAVTAGLSMTGLRAANFSSGQGIAYMHESLYAAVGKRLTYVLNMGCRAMTKASLNVHAGHDDYHAIDDTGFFQLFAKDVQQVADLNIIAHRIAELSLNPGIIAQDGFLTTHLMESALVPERELIREYLGLPSDIIKSPTAAQVMLFGGTRRRIPTLWDVDNPLLAGPVQNQESYMHSVAAQRPYFFKEIMGLAKIAFAEFQDLTGRSYGPLGSYQVEDADYIILGQGSMISNAEAVVDFLRTKKKLKVGVINLTMFRPFPGAALSQLLEGKKGVAVLERVDQPLAEDLPIMKEVRSALFKAMENAATLSNGHQGYQALKKAPVLYSGVYGLGSRDLQPEALIGAIENMIEGGPRFFYLSIDFFRSRPLSPKDEIHLDQIAEGYPEVKDLSIHGSENPNLMPKDSMTLRIHSIGGWGGIASGKSLTLTLADILGYYVKANPKYGSEKKGQPTTFYLSVASEPIKVNCEYFYIDLLLSPDPKLFEHSNPLGGLKSGGVLVLQREETDPKQLWESIPQRYQKEIKNKQIKVFAVNASKIAKEEATKAELILRMQGMAFQGAFFKASPLQAITDLPEEILFAKIKAQLTKKFISKGAKLVEDNFRAVKRGYEEVIPVDYGVIASELDRGFQETPLPSLLKTLPKSKFPLSDLHRFWEQTGVLYKSGQTSQILADPFAATGLIPAMSGVFRDLTDIRLEHPRWIANNCTGCGKCWVACPDSALPAVVTPVADLFTTALRHLPQSQSLAKVTRQLEPKLRVSLASKPWKEAIVELQGFAAEQPPPKGVTQEVYQEELKMFFDEIAPYDGAITKPYFTTMETKALRPGGLLNIVVHPENCKGCMECVEVCNDQALVAVPQNKASVQALHQRWVFWQKLPTTRTDYRRIADLEEGIGALEGLLLDKKTYFAMLGGDGACLGCGEKTVTHLFISTLTALMAPRVEAFLAELDQLVLGLKAKISESLTPKLEDSAALETFLQGHKKQTVSLKSISTELNLDQPLDGSTLLEQAHLIHELEALKELYLGGPTGQGRSLMGQINSTGCSSVWGSTYPINPYPVPWVNHLFQDAPSIALGIFEGHMSKMAENFKVVRRAKTQLGQLEPEDLTYFDWESFTDPEYDLCPPVVCLGGDGAMYDIGLQNLSRLLMTGKPIKVVILDTQSYSNTGGQACTSGFKGQESDMAIFGKQHHGKSETRKEIGLIALAHRNSFVLQSGLASSSHLIEGVIRGLKSRRPALFNLYCTCQPEHGAADDTSTKQAKLALESRAYPYFSYDPDLGDQIQDCLDLSGNPNVNQDWLSLPGADESGEVTFTFADFAITEGRFRKHFTDLDPESPAPTDVADYLELDEKEQLEVTPVVRVQVKDGGWQLLQVSREITESCLDRRDFWRKLQSLAGLNQVEVNEAEIKETLQKQLHVSLTKALINLTKGEG